MIGKLVVWKGDHRKDAPEKVRSGSGNGLGGFVSLEQLDDKTEVEPRSKAPSKTFRKKSPKHFLIKKSSATRPPLPDDELFNAPLSQVSSAGSKSSTPRHIPLFSNIPGYENAANYDQIAGYGIEKPPSNPVQPPPSPQRPKTADATTGRKRSTTAQSRTSFEPPLPWSEKVLPLAIDLDRKRSVSEKSDAQRKQSSEIAERPKTSSGATNRSSLAGKRNQSDTTLSRKQSGASYSLTPSLSQSENRRASQASKATVAKSASIASNGSASKSHQRSGSGTSVQSTGMTKNRPSSRKGKADDRSILDEVEGTLSATITELQELNAVWHAHSPPVPEIHPAFLEDSKPAAVPMTTPVQQNGPDYFSAKSHRRSSSTGLPPASAPRVQSTQSLPPTPLNSTHPKSAPSSTSSDHSRLQELQASYDSQKRKAQTLSTENAQLKSQLLATMQRIAEIDAVRNDRDKFERDALETRAKYESLEGQLGAANVTIESTTNRLHAVEARLEDANEQRVDLLEQNNDLQERMVAMQRQIEELSREIAELRSRPDHATVNAVRRQSVEVQAKNFALEEQIRAKGGRTDLASIVAELNSRLDDAERTKEEKNTQLQVLSATITTLQNELNEKDNTNKNLTTLSQQAQQKLLTETQSSALKMTEIQQKASAAEKAKRAALAERDKFEQLLLAEFRRTAIEMHSRSHPAEPLLSKKMDVDAAVEAVRKKAEAALAEKSDKPSYDGAEYEDDERERKIQELEREVQYYLRDIVLYKLDVKGYKKDLRKAQGRIVELENKARVERWKDDDKRDESEEKIPVTPPRPQQPNGKESRTPQQHHHPVQPPTASDRESEAEQRPSISSQSSTSTAPGMSNSSSGTGRSRTESSPETPRAELGVAVALKVPATGRGSVEGPSGRMEVYRPRGMSRGSPVKMRTGVGVGGGGVAGPGGVDMF